MESKKKKRSQNTTHRQYEEYLELMETDEIFRTNKINPSVSPDYLNECWRTLSNRLNSCDSGPVLSPKEWVKRFNDWKNATRAKYRKMVENRIKTGGGKDEEIKLSSLEDRGLTVWGKVAVTGSPDVPLLGGLQHFLNQKQKIPSPTLQTNNDTIRKESSNEFILEQEIQEAEAVLQEENINLNLFKSKDNSVKPSKPSTIKKKIHREKRMLESQSVKSLGEELLNCYKNDTSRQDDLELKKKRLKLDIAKFKFEVAKYKYENPFFSFSEDDLF